ncbi:hypothetical protein HK097_008435 [Rhizophlyctis rosea]|uniref:Cyclic nucleotide-binding domain-containing protein n=1 Tax=Rhizophlyctis rosea TaxID=64517 RepID=A0AAD5SN40_9FUNG|nr:hypothetical protein HK097_008435 [Rhizophlyctis rosea]
MFPALHGPREGLKSLLRPRKHRDPVPLEQGWSKSEAAPSSLTLDSSSSPSKTDRPPALPPKSITPSAEKTQPKESRIPRADNQEQIAKYLGNESSGKASALSAGGQKRNSIWDRDDEELELTKRKGIPSDDRKRDNEGTQPKMRRASINVGQLSQTTRLDEGVIMRTRSKSNDYDTISHVRRTTKSHSSSPSSTLNRPSLHGSTTSSTPSNRRRSSLAHQLAAPADMGDRVLSEAEEEEDDTHTLGSPPMGSTKYPRSLTSDKLLLSPMQRTRTRNKSFDSDADSGDEGGSRDGRSGRSRQRRGSSFEVLKGREDSTTSTSSGKDLPGRSRRQSMGTGLDYDALLSGKFDNKPAALLGHLRNASRNSSNDSLDGGRKSRLGSRDLLFEESLVEPVKIGRERTSLSRPRQSITTDSGFDAEAAAKAASKARRRQSSSNSQSGVFDPPRRRGSMAVEDPRVTAQKRWQWSITLTLKLLKSSSLFRVAAAPDTAAGFLQSLTQRDAVLNGERLSAILATKPPLRSNTQIRQLDTLLCTMPSFARYAADVRTELGKSAVYIAAAPGRVVIKEGQEPLFVYFLFNGVCSSSSSSPSRVDEEGNRSYRHGEMIGGLALSAPDLRRPYTITTVTAAELVGVPKEAFVDAMSSAGHQSYRLGMEQLLRGVSAFEQTPEKILKEFIDVGRR